MGEQNERCINEEIKEIDEEIISLKAKVDQDVLNGNTIDEALSFSQMTDLETQKAALYLQLSNGSGTPAWDAAAHSASEAVVFCEHATAVAEIMNLSHPTPDAAITAISNIKSPVDDDVSIDLKAVEHAFDSGRSRQIPGDVITVLKADDTEIQNAITQLKAAETGLPTQEVAEIELAITKLENLDAVVVDLESEAAGPTVC